MGRSICLSETDPDDRDDVTTGYDCCIIARAPVPAGYGPKPVPYPLIA